MAIDTQSKRMSAALEGLVMPSATPGAAEREAVAWLYNGIAPGGYTPPVAATTGYLHEIGNINRLGVYQQSSRNPMRIGR